MDRVIKPFRYGDKMLARDDKLDLSGVRNYESLIRNRFIEKMEVEEVKEVKPVSDTPRKKTRKKVK